MREKEKSVAIITINGLGDFTPKGAKQVANWLRQNADYVEKEYKLWTNKKAIFRYIIKQSPSK